MTSQIKKRLSALEDLHGEPEEPIPDGLAGLDERFHEGMEEWRATGVCPDWLKRDIYGPYGLAHFYGGNFDPADYWGGVPALAEGMQ